jgi:hypothetical protein
MQACNNCNKHENMKYSFYPQENVSVNIIFGNNFKGLYKLNVPQTMHVCTRVIQKVKIQHGWEGKVNHRKLFRSQPRPRAQRFPFVFAFKEISGRPEVS